MTLRWLIATLHLLALPIGVAAVAARASALKVTRDSSDLPRVFSADNWWGLAALLWLATGPWRAFGALDKGASYYLSHPLFHAKLGLFIVLLLLEVWPMVTLIKWRQARRKGQVPDLSKVGQLARISYVELAIVVIIVFLATAVARGFGT